jgi:Carboxypeptidase regulatory-like domain/TonB dependent receptor
MNALPECIDARVFFILLCLFFSCGINTTAQQNISGAELSGRIMDPDGALIPGAKVSVKELTTNRTQTTVTDGEGNFLFNYLPVGEYEMRVEVPGFGPEIRRVTLTVGQAINVSLVMDVGIDKVTVTIEPSTVETTRTQVSETIVAKDVARLPLNGRNFLDLALLAPAVSRTNTGGVQRFAETSAVPGTGISIAGQRNLNVSFVVDGSSANDDSVELAGTYYSQEVVREFQVISNGALAQFGRASSGFVNIVTNSGTNELRGKLYGFLRSDRFDARNPLAASRDPLTQTQYGASLGGPLKKDRTFFFANFEQTRRNDSNIITISPANVTAINTRLSGLGYRGPLIQTGLVPGGYDTTNFFARIDHRLGKNNSLSASYNFYDIDAQNARTVGGLNAVSRGTNLSNNDHTFNLAEVATFDANTFNEFRFQFRRSRLDAPPIDEVGPAVNISGVANFGTATTSPTKRNIDLYQLSDAYTAVAGDHVFKVGAEFIYNKLDIGFPGAVQGVYTFSPVTLPRIAGCDPPGGATISLSALEAFTSPCRAPVYSQFQQAFGAVSQKQSNPNLGFFGQDEWRAHPKITLNFGLRYDLQFLPGPINTDRNNISPRFGFAYAPNEKTVLRGSFGLYYDRIPTRATSNALQRDGSKYIVAQLAPGAPGAPVFPNVLAAAPSVLLVKPNITRIDPNIENSYTEQAGLQIERELPFDSSLSVGYLFVRGLNLILSRNVNVPSCTAAVNPNLCRPDPNFGNIGRFEGAGESNYNGMIVSFNKRHGSWADVRVSYTFSKALDNSGNFFFSTPQNNFDLNDDWGLSDNDQRHRLTLNGSFYSSKTSGGSLLHKLYRDLELSYIFTYASRLPFNIVTGNDRNGDTNNNDRPLGVGRNTGHGFDYSSLDLRLSRKFILTEKINLELLVEGFNVLNRANFSVPNNTFGAGVAPLASFGRPTAAFDPRQIQLGVRFNF